MSFTLGARIPVGDGTHDPAEEAVTHLKKRLGSKMDNAAEKTAYSEISAYVNTNYAYVRHIRVVPERPEESSYVLKGNCFKGYIVVRYARNQNLNVGVLYLVPNS